MYSALILAGGFGTRLRPVTDTVPKPMAPVCGEPNLVRIAGLLCKNGFDSAVVTLKYLGSKISGSLGDLCRGVDLYYMTEDEPLGTAGAAAAAAELLEDDFLVISGDTVCDLDLFSAYEFHKKTAAVVTVITHRVTDPLEYGCVVSDGGGKITGFREKPTWQAVASDSVNTGIYIMSRRVFSYIPKGVRCDFSLDVFPKLLRAGERMSAFEAPGYWRDIGSCEEYLKANLELIGSDGKRPALPDGAYNSVCGDGFRMGENSSFINSVAFDGVGIGSGCSVTGSILCRNVSVGDGCVLRDGCVIGEGAVICDGVKLGAKTKIPAGRTVTENKGETYVSRKKLFENGRIVFSRGRDGTAELCRAAYAVAEAAGGPVGVCRASSYGGERSAEAELFARAVCAAGCACYNFGEVNPFAAAVAGAYFDVPVTAVVSKGASSDQTVVSFYDRTGMSLFGSIEKKINAAYFSDPPDPKEPGALKRITGLSELYYSALSSLCDLSGAQISLYHFPDRADTEAALKAAGAMAVSADGLYENGSAFIVNPCDGAVLLGQGGAFCSFDTCLLILLGMTDPEKHASVSLPFFLPPVYAKTAEARGIAVMRYLSKPGFPQETDLAARRARLSCPWTFDPLFCAAYLIHHLTRAGITLEEARSEYADVVLKRTEIRVPESEKASVLRRLYETYLPYQISAADGIEIAEANARGVIMADDTDRLRLFLSADDEEAAEDAAAEIFERFGRLRS